ncbi:MAG: CRISPR-associated protein [Candidatus Fermentithermobacillus carboniphilus]|uniref:CRISPR-associated protein n=1 Tax=Candidatus Fermentithermobacillus carboniphilus TaxID=3085328 RepID=A0AAT9LD50_9FIRM|nr:MAG: CRISPR-associated protein [Candidatus Fermentithermobacillus carboniphilus]
MNLELLKEFKDPYMKTPEGQGAFLSGVLLGYIAYRQVAPSREEGASKGSSAQGIDKSPLFKQIQFGRLDGRSLKRLLARVPQLIAAYGESLSGVSGSLSRLCAKAGELLLSGKSDELGVDGNFAFTIGFTNSVAYFWRIFEFRDESGDQE